MRKVMYIKLFFPLLSMSFVLHENILYLDYNIDYIKEVKINWIYTTEKYKQLVITQQILTSEILTLLKCSSLSRYQRGERKPFLITKVCMVLNIGEKKTQIESDIKTHIPLGSQVKWIKAMQMIKLQEIDLRVRNIWKIEQQ